MENFNVSKYFRDKLFEQEDQLEPKDDDVDSAFTKGEKEEEDQEEKEEINNPDYEEDLAAVKKTIADVVVSGNTKVSKSILPMKPLLSIIEDQFDDPYSQTHEFLKDNYGFEESTVEMVLDFFPGLIVKILFFEYILPDKPDDKIIEPILGELATYFDVDINSFVSDSIGDSVKYYKIQNKYTKSGKYDNIRYDRQIGFVKK